MATAVAMLVIISIPLDYEKIEGVRFITVKCIAIISIILIFSRRISQRDRKILTVSAIVLSYIAAATVIGGNASYLLACTVFMMLAFWPLAIDWIVTEQFRRLLTEWYIVIAVVTAVVMIAQHVFAVHFGVRIGNVKNYGLRLAVGATWSDYSFLSLYLCSCLPLLLEARWSFVWRGVSAIVLLVAAILTSARTGLVALGIASLVTIVATIVSDLWRAKPRVWPWLMLAATGGLGILLFYLLSLSTGRPLSLESASRLSGYDFAFEQIIRHPIFGLYFDLDAFGKTRPHNAVVEFLLLGGGVFLLFVTAWLLTVVWEVRNVSLGLGLGLATVLVGTMFLPSFFSAYFAAVLVSIAMLERKSSALPAR